MMSCFDLTILEVFDQYCFGILFGCLLRTEVYGDLLVVRCGYLWRTNGFVIYFEMHFSCSLRTNAYYDLF